VNFGPLLSNWESCQWQIQEFGMADFLPSLPLEVDPLNPARESGGAFKLPQQGGI